MPKKIIVNNSGSYQELTSSLQISDSGVLSSSYQLSIDTASFPGNSGLMQVFGGQLKPVATSSTANPQSNYSGSVLAYSTAEGFGPHRTEAASFSGDLSGDLINGVRVRSVSNVTGGILTTLYGGTGADSVNTGGMLFSSGSKPVFGPTNQMLAVTGSSGQVNLINTSSLSFTPMTGTIVYLYTGSVGVNNSFTWTKPAGCRFVRIICQGGGGGGGAIVNVNQSPAFGGGGGGGGGYSEIIYNGINIPTTVTGVAGLGGSGGSSPIAGGSSSFGQYLYALGGGAGATGNNTSAAGGAGGIGYIEFGGAGGKSGGSTAAPAVAGGDVNKSGAGGGGGGGNGSSTFSSGARGGNVGILSLTGGLGGAGNRNGGSAGGSGASSSAYWTNIGFYLNNNLATFSSLPAIFCSGGGGGGGGSGGTSTFTPGGAGGAVTFASGGGGKGGNGRGFSPQNSGNGGAGYVLIICY